MKNPPAWAGRRLVKNVLAQIISNTGRLGEGFVIAVVVARLGDAETYGIYAAITSYVILFKFATLWGLQSLVVREVSRRRELVQQYVTNCLVLIAGMSILTMILIFSANHWLNVTQELVLLGAASLRLILDGIGLFFSGIFYAFEKMELDTLTVLAEVISAVIFGIIIVSIWPGLLALMVALVLSKLFNIGLSLALYLRYIGKFEHRISIHLWPGLLITTLPFGVQMLLNNLSQMHVVLLSLYQGNATTGYFRLSEQVVFIFGQFSLVMSQALYPQLSIAFEKSRDEFRRLLHRGIHYLFVSGVLISLCLLLFSEPLITLAFGSKNIPAAFYLRFLSSIVLLTFLGNILGTSVTAADRQGWRTASQTFVILIYVGLGMVWIPKYGAIGASWILLVMSALRLIFALFFTVSICGWPYPLLQALPATLAGLAFGGFTCIAKSLPPLVVMLAGILLFSAIFILLDPLARQDWKRLGLIDDLRKLAFRIRKKREIN